MQFRYSVTLLRLCALSASMPLFAAGDVLQAMPCACALASYMGLWQMLGDAPARTFEFHVDAWQNTGWGLHNIDRRTISGNVAVSRDGSRRNKLSAVFYRHYFFRRADYELETIYRRPEHVLYRFDDGGNVITTSSCSCTWDTDLLPKFDSECRQAATARLGKSTRLGNGYVAGVPVVRYRAIDKDERHDLALAPQFNCNLLEETRDTYNSLGLPTAHMYFVVISYKPGEPHSQLFALPAGSTLVKGPPRWP